MEGTGVIDQFLDLFSRYIDSGFGLINQAVIEPDALKPADLDETP